MEGLKETLKQVLEGYTVEGLNGYSYLTTSADDKTITSVSIGYLDGKQFAFVDLLVRLIGDRIVIDHDANSAPLVDALMEAGIKREKIVLAYAGEPVPEIA
jgi:predicted NBD/HSP70 family sugar kinase